jgi:hypothetical protein
VDIVLRLAVAEGRPQHRTEGLEAVAHFNLQPIRSKQSGNVVAGSQAYDVAVIVVLTT